MANVRLTIAYDGTSYYGWQRTEMGPSVEESLQCVIEKILQEKIVLQAASRTDAGVHALGQVVNFITRKQNFNTQKFLVSLNSLLPKDISVISVHIAKENFHPTLDNKGKTYHYSVCFGVSQLPQNRFYSWHYPHELNLTLMQEGAQIFIGKHDFTSFCNSKKNASYKNHVREISEILIEQEPGKKITFKITGNHFLYKMVRNIVGTLIYVGRGLILKQNLLEIISDKNRSGAGVTAPAHGLTLYKVIY
jgi:tRNA pseudouridine38-40 synthase